MFQSVIKERKSKKPVTPNTKKLPKDHLIKILCAESFKRELVEFVGDGNLSAFVRKAIAEKIERESK